MTPPLETIEEQFNLSFMRYMRTHQVNGDVWKDEVNAYLEIIERYEVKRF